jgi:acyl-CoA dehydrogenase
MNAARLAVAMQGVAIAERATQRAIAYAAERKQGRAAGSHSGEMSPIIEHADIKRTLMTMKSLTQASRATCFALAREIDRSHRAKTEAERADGAARAALLTPIAKAFSTDCGCDVASMGIQVHGGMGFIEETGAAQHLRDARILPIYEGTNGIQAIDLVTRKLPLGGGEVVKTYFGELAETVREVSAVNRTDFGRMGARLSEALAALQEASAWMDKMLQKNPEAALAGATPYLRLFAVTAGGVYLARGALAAVREGEDKVPPNTIAIARFFAENIAVSAPGLAAAITTGGETVADLSPARLSA